MNGFFAKELAGGANCYMIGMGDDVYNWFGYSPGSFNVISARILGLPYDEFLRYTRDNFKGKIEGINAFYPWISFSTKEDFSELVKVLNDRWKEFLERFKETRDEDYNI